MQRHVRRVSIVKDDVQGVSGVKDDVHGVSGDQVLDVPNVLQVRDILQPQVRDVLRNWVIPSRSTKGGINYNTKSAKEGGRDWLIILTFSVPYEGDLESGFTRSF